MNIELTATFDSEVVEVSDANPARMLVDVGQIATVMERDIDLRQETHRKVTEISLKPSIAEYGANDEVVQGHRLLFVAESFDAVKAAIKETEAIGLPS